MKIAQASKLVSKMAKLVDERSGDTGLDEKIDQSEKEEKPYMMVQKLMTDAVQSAAATSIAVDSDDTSKRRDPLLINLMDGSDREIDLKVTMKNKGKSPDQARIAAATMNIDRSISGSLLKKGSLGPDKEVDKTPNLQLISIG